MKDAGMMLHYVSREEYRNKQLLIDSFLLNHDDYYYVPEGGQGANGVKGASEILSLARAGYSHIICGVGTGTTLAGLVASSDESQQVLGISSLKSADNNSNEIIDYISANSGKSNFSVNFDYHFGGYAKKNDDLIAFMNALYNEERIATDFVYTAKMFYGVYDLVKNNHFPSGSKLLLIHTGGLQGNSSLSKGTLVF
jgi:D-cysteine desulfhydrase